MTQAFEQHLFELLKTHTNKSELETICFKVNIPFAELSGETHSDKVRELVLYARRHQLMTILSEELISTYPRIPWPTLSNTWYIPESLRNEIANHIKNTLEEIELEEAVKKMGRSQLLLRETVEMSNSFFNNRNLATFDQLGKSYLQIAQVLIDGGLVKSEDLFNEIERKIIDSTYIIENETISYLYENFSALNQLFLDGQLHMALLKSALSTFDPNKIKLNQTTDAQLMQALSLDQKLQIDTLFLFERIIHGLNIMKRNSG